MNASTISRRGALLMGIASTILGSPGEAQSQDLSNESQAGDPQAEPEIIVADQGAIGNLFSIVAFDIKKDAKQVALRTLAIAREFVDKNEQQNPEMVEDFFAIFTMPARN